LFGTDKRLPKDNQINAKKKQKIYERGCEQVMNRYIESGIKAILFIISAVYILWVTDTLHIMMGWPY